MKLITTVVRPERLPQVKAALFRAGVTGVTISRVSGNGGERELHEHYRGANVVLEFREKVRLEMAVSEPFVEPTINAILNGVRGADHQRDPVVGAHRGSRRREDLRAAPRARDPNQDRRGGHGRSHCGHCGRGTAAGAQASRAIAPRVWRVSDSFLHEQSSRRVLCVLSAPCSLLRCGWLPKARHLAPPTRPRRPATPRQRLRTTWRRRSPASSSPGSPKDRTHIPVGASGTRASSGGCTTGCRTASCSTRWPSCSTSRTTRRSSARGSTASCYWARMPR